MDWDDLESKRRPRNPSGVPEVKLPHIDFSQIKGRTIWLIVAIIAIIWGLTGIYRVQIDEKGAVLRFGKLNAITGPGLHYRIPWPFEKVFKPKVTEIKRIELGFRTVDPGPPARYTDVAKESLMLTGDENIIDVDIIVQYKIADAVNYLFNVRQADDTVREAAEAAVREIIGSRGIDEALTVGKFQIQEDTRALLQKILDKYITGLQVVQVQLQDVRPPGPVADAFRDVASAREDKERLIREAQGYRNDLIPKARGKAAQVIRDAEAYSEEKKKRALGDSNRFLAVLAEYNEAKEITRKRLYIETMELVLPDIEKYIIESDKGGALLQLLPLTKKEGVATGK